VAPTAGGWPGAPPVEAARAPSIEHHGGVDEEEAKVSSCGGWHWERDGREREVYLVAQERLARARDAARPGTVLGAGRPSTRHGQREAEPHVGAREETERSRRSPPATKAMPNPNP
jgi:hypothetical protein